jgi:predicted metal-dependent phosphotriesterase family hydrolase
MKTSHSRPISRRTFIKFTSVWLTGSGLASAVAGDALTAPSPRVQTVLGPIPTEQLGFTLVHEHVMCDFVGADRTNRNRWEVAEVVRVMKPRLLQLKERQVRGFVDCTPAYIGRDPRVLQLLAEETGLHLVTNTGYYGGAGDKYVPKHAYAETAMQLADRWVREIEEGIAGTSVKPGFIKTGVDEATGHPPRLSDIDTKLIQAAALASRRSGLSVVCHTGGGPAGWEAAEQFMNKGADPARFVVAHSDGHGLETNLKLAEKGVWVSFDGLGGQPLEAHLKYVLPILGKHSNRLLLSMDSGWFWVGESGGGKIRDYNYLADIFLPALEKSGVSVARLREVTVVNPARVFGRV